MSALVMFTGDVRDGEHVVFDCDRFRALVVSADGQETNRSEYVERIAGIGRWEPLDPQRRALVEAYARRLARGARDKFDRGTEGDRMFFRSMAAAKLYGGLNRRQTVDLDRLLFG